MTERDAATRLADLEDRFLDQAGPKMAVAMRENRRRTSFPLRAM